MVLMTYWGGMRIGEVASLKIKDVMALDDTT
jgi:integrase